MLEFSSTRHTQSCLLHLRASNKPALAALAALGVEITLDALVKTWLVWEHYNNATTAAVVLHEAEQ